MLNLLGIPTSFHSHNRGDWLVTGSPTVSFSVWIKALEWKRKSAQLTTRYTDCTWVCRRGIDRVDFGALLPAGYQPLVLEYLMESGELEVSIPSPVDEPEYSVLP